MTIKNELSSESKMPQNGNGSAWRWIHNRIDTATHNKNEIVSDLAETKWTIVWRIVRNAFDRWNRSYTPNRDLCEIRIQRDRPTDFRCAHRPRIPFRNLYSDNILSRLMDDRQPNKKHDNDEEKTSSESNDLRRRSRVGADDEIKWKKLQRKEIQLATSTLDVCVLAIYRGNGYKRRFERITQCRSRWSAQLGNWTKRMMDLRFDDADATDWHESVFEDFWIQNIGSEFWIFVALTCFECDTEVEVPSDDGLLTNSGRCSSWS